MLTDDLEIPTFLRLTAQQRKQAWLDHPPTTCARNSTGIKLTETERLYRASIERDKALKRELDQQRWAELKARKLADKAERDGVKRAVRQARRSEMRGDL